MTSQAKLDAMKRGERVITNEEQMEEMMRLESETMDDVRSIPNPNRVGVKDQYVAWID